MPGRSLRADSGGGPEAQPASNGQRCVRVFASAICVTTARIEAPKAGNCRTALVSATQTGGTLHLAAADLVLTSTGGTTGPFRYVYVWNDTPTSPADPLIGYWDYGSAITLNDGETLTIDLPSDILTLA
jgi:hypothetical protein